MLKRIIAAAFAALMMFPFTGQVYAADEAALSFGDPNGDGKIDAKDASFVLEAYAKLSTGAEDVLTSAEQTAADVKTDGNVDAKDASAILAYYAYLSTGGSYTLPVFLCYEEPEEYEYKLENITKSADVFNYFADQLNYEILQGADIQAKHKNHEQYWSNGQNEARVALFLLNENEFYESGVLTEVFKNYNTQDYEDGILYWIDIVNLQKRHNKYINFNNYTKDNQIGNYLNNMESAWQNAIKNDDCTELDKILEEFYNDEQMVYEDALYYYSIGITLNCPKSLYSNSILIDNCEEDFSNTRNQIKEKTK